MSKGIKHVAPGQYLGFGLQPVRLCYHLLTGAPGDRVSLEHLDDVAVHRADGSILIEQTKSALTGNPLSDWSDDLWKTLANWVQALDSGQFDLAKTEYCLYVTPVKSKVGKLVAAMDTATTAQDVAKLMADLQGHLSKRSSPPACIAHVNAFLDADPVLRVQLISRFSVANDDSDPVAPLKGLLKTAIDADTAEALVRSAIGHAKEAADALLRKGQSAILPCDAFQQWFRAYVRHNNMPGYLSSLGQTPAGDVVAGLLAARPVFVQQLGLIDAPDDDTLRAVSDFLRASATKSEWAERGLVFKENLESWDEDLLRHHSAVRGEIEILHPTLAAGKRGRAVYSRCLTANPALDGHAVPGFFIHGSFNALAEYRRLGWHPDYMQLLPPESS